jgi:hypothetical protein
MDQHSEHYRAPAASFKRKTISPGLRFDILNRDGFTCYYCGRRPPEVKLHIDHRIPVAKGGATVPENLFTACLECNLGKRTKEIGASDPTAETRRKAAREAITLANEAVIAEEARETLRIVIVNHWLDAFHEEECDPYTLKVIISYARQHGVETVLSWIDYVASMKEFEFSPDSARGRYLSGIRRRWLQEGGANE